MAIFTPLPYPTAAPLLTDIDQNGLVGWGVASNPRASASCIALRKGSIGRGETGEEHGVFSLF
jgi:hypothetical protein